MVKKTDKKKTIKLLDQLFQIHKVYKNMENNKKRVFISEKCEPIFSELETLGIGRAFSETFLCYGDEFLSYEWGIGWDRMRNI